MNNAMKTALNEVRNNPTDADKVKALTEIAVPKFKKVYGKVQKAVKTINRHIGDGKGTPNRATLATAIGLADEIYAYNEVATLTNLPEMTDAIKVIADLVTAIKGMRDTRTYTHIAYLPDFLTNAEKEENRITDAKVYLYNVIGGVNRAIDTIDRHIADGTFDVNTFKVAKAIGYKDEIAYLRNELANLAPELAKVDEVEQAINAVIADKGNGFINGIAPIADYNPFPEPEDEVADDTEADNEDAERR